MRARADTAGAAVPTAVGHLLRPEAASRKSQVASRKSQVRRIRAVQGRVVRHSPKGASIVAVPISTTATAIFMGHTSFAVPAPGA
jgi:hypothetical protein